MLRQLIFLVIALALLVSSAFAESEISIYTDQVRDQSLTFCPQCGRPIRPGPIHQDAEAILLDELRQALADSGVKYNIGRNGGRSIEAFIYRFQDRKGGNFAVDKPASVGFHLHLIEQERVVKVFQFDETQQPLSENILKFGTFLRRGAKWVTASELAEEGVEKGITYFREDLR
jgi:hypothetical protein